jgi:hypothetical protein
MLKERSPQEVRDAEEPSEEEAMTVEIRDTGRTTGEPAETVYEILESALKFESTPSGMTTRQAELAAQLQVLVRLRDLFRDHGHAATLALLKALRRVETVDGFQNLADEVQERKDVVDAAIALLP